MGSKHVLVTKIIKNIHVEYFKVNCVVFRKDKANKITNYIFTGNNYYLKAGQQLDIFFSDKKPPKKKTFEDRMNEINHLNA